MLKCDKLLQYHCLPAYFFSTFSRSVLHLHIAEFFWLEILVEVRLGLTDIGNADKYSILSLNGLGEI
jgi:hypothetical protein